MDKLRKLSQAKEKEIPREMRAKIADVFENVWAAVCMTHNPERGKREPVSCSEIRAEYLECFGWKAGEKKDAQNVAFELFLREMGSAIGCSQEIIDAIVATEEKLKKLNFSDLDAQPEFPDENIQIVLRRKTREFYKKVLHFVNERYSQTGNDLFSNITVGIQATIEFAKLMKPETEVIHVDFGQGEDESLFQEEAVG